MLSAATLKVAVKVTGLPEAGAQLRRFEGELRDVSGKEATAKLSAEVKSGGFREYAAKIDEARAKASKDIVTEAKVKTDSSAFSQLQSWGRKIEQAWGGGGGRKGVGTAIGEALTPFGKLPSVVAAASPVLVDLAGALTAVAGSAAEAGAGLGALGIGAGGVATVGIGGIASVAIPAISSLKELTKAQAAYTQAVNLYGGHSKEAATALAKLHLAEQKAGPEAAKLSESLQRVEKVWGHLTKPGREAFLGGLEDAITRLQSKLPLLSESANRSTEAARKGFDIFLKQVTGPDWERFIRTMTRTEEYIVPRLSHAFGDWGRILMRVADAAAPSLKHITDLFSEWSDRMLASTSNARDLRRDVSGLTGQFLSWVHLLGAAGRLLIAVFGAGAGQGQRLVDDLTGKLKEWTGWIETHQARVHAFFQRAADTTRVLTTLLAGFLPQFIVLSEAMRPIAQAFLSITRALNSIKIGNVSALTALLGAYVGLRGIGKIADSIGALRTLGAAGGAATAGGEAAAGAEGAVAGGVLSRFGARALASKFAPVGAAAAGYFATEFGAKLTEKLSHSNILEGQSLAGSLLHGFSTKGVKETEERAFAKLSARDAMEKLRSGIITRLPDIRKLAEQASKGIAQGFEKGTPAWRAAAGQSMLAVVSAIKDGERQGAISASTGQQEIARIMRQYHLVTGDDPFHIARAFTTTWARAGHVNNAQINNALSELQRMPPAARRIARDMMLLQVREYERGGQLAKGSFSKLRSAVASEMHGTKIAGIREMMGLVRAMAGGSSSMDTAVSAGLSVLGKNVNSALKGFGVGKKLSFTLTTIGQDLATVGVNSILGKQSGGHINMGKPSGDSVPAMLERGEYVLNRNAVRAVGKHNLDAINFGGAPRFQKGGGVKEPKIAGPGPLDNLAQAGIHHAYKAAQHYLNAHRPKASGLAGLSVPTGPIEQMARAMVERIWGPSQWGPFAALEAREAGWNPRALNPKSGAAGLAQALPSSKYPPGAWPYRGPESAKLQLAWMMGYIKERYGSPAGAWAHEQSAGWYQRGGSVGVPKGTNPSPSELRRYLDWKWGGARRYGGGLIGAAEHELGVPQSHHKPHEHATASDAVRWAMRHLGSGDQWGYPGEWCGAFIAADMKAQGLPVPSGYAAAANWANYGTPLGRGHIQAGAILDYGSSHVAMAISSSEQIQGNDIHGQVGTSGIGGVIGVSTLTAVRWPPYGTGPGAGSSLSEKVPGVFHGARTHNIPFPPIPKNIHGVEAQIHHWEVELATYRRAYAAAKGRPVIQRAIKGNITRIEGRLNELRRARAKLRREASRHRFTHRLAGKLGRITGLEQAIEGRRRAYEIAAQNAEQIVALEPQEGSQDAFSAYVTGREAPAYGRVLVAEADWRNTILSAETRADTIEYGLENVIRDLSTELAQSGKASPQAKANLRFRIAQYRETLGKARGEFYGGRRRPVQPPAPPLAGTGTFEQSLIEVQGIHWPDQHETLAALALALPPQAGRFGGAIWDTQMAISELGTKVKQFAGGGTGTEGGGERTQLLEELLLQANQRNLVKQIGTSTLAGFPYAGAYASGGVVSALVGEKGPEIAAFPTGTRITPANETRKALTPTVIVNGNIVQAPGDSRDPVEVVIGDRRFAPAVREAALGGRGVGAASAVVSRR